MDTYSPSVLLEVRTELCPVSVLEADEPFERVRCRKAEAFLSLSALEPLEERRLLPAPPADEEQALGAAGAGHDHHLHRHLEHG